MSIVARPPDPGQTGVRTIPRPYQDNPDHPWTVRITPESLAAPLPDRAFRVWLALDLHAGSKAYCWVGDEAIARETGKQPRSISRIVAELEEAKYIRRVYANGVTEPGKGEKAQRIGIILRRRVNPNTPAADTAEAIERAKAALADRSGSTTQSCVVPLRRVAKSDYAELRTEGLRIDPVHIEDVKGERPLDRPEGEPEQASPPEAPGSPETHPEPEPAPKFDAPHRRPPEGSMKLPAAELRRLIDRADANDTAAERAELAGHIARSLDDDHSFVFWCRVVTDLAGGKLSPHAVNYAVEAGLNTDGTPGAVANSQIKKARANRGRLPAQPFPSSPAPRKSPRTTPAPVYPVVRDDGFFADLNRDTENRHREASRAESPPPRRPAPPPPANPKADDRAARAEAERVFAAMVDAARDELEWSVHKGDPILMKDRPIVRQWCIDRLASGWQPAAAMA